MQVAWKVLRLTSVNDWLVQPLIAVFEPSAKNATVPPPSAGVTVAVKVTD